jgi:hypothetical protein
VKTRPVLNCRLENVVVDKSPLHQPPFNRRGHACSLLTRTTSGRFWANGRRLGNSPDVNGHLIVKGAADSDVEICSAHLRLVAIKKPHVHTRTSGLENPEVRTRSRPGNKLIFFKRERDGLRVDTRALLWHDLPERVIFGPGWNRGFCFYVKPVREFAPQDR